MTGDQSVKSPGYINGRENGKKGCKSAVTVAELLPQKLAGVEVSNACAPSPLAIAFLLRTLPNPEPTSGSHH